MRLLVTPVSNLSNVLLSHFTLLPSGLMQKKKRRKGNRNHGLRLRYIQCPDACSVVTLRVFARNAPMFVQIEIHGVRGILSLMLSSFGRIWQRRHMKIYIFLFQRCFCIYSTVLYSSIAQCDFLWECGQAIDHQAFLRVLLSMITTWVQHHFTLDLPRPPDHQLRSQISAFN